MTAMPHFCRIGPPFCQRDLAVLNSRAQRHPRSIPPNAVNSVIMVARMASLQGKNAQVSVGQMLQWLLVSCRPTRYPAVLALKFPKSVERGLAKTLLKKN